MEQSERLRYDPLDHQHADGLFAALDDERVGRYINGPDVTTLEALESRIEFLGAGHSPSNPEEQWVNVVVLRREDDVVVGRVEATVLGPRAEIAYVFGPSYWGQGYATEATRWLIDHLRARFDIQQIWASIHHENVASRRLVERVGMRHVAPPTPALMSYDDGDVVFLLEV